MKFPDRFTTAFNWQVRKPLRSQDILRILPSCSIREENYANELKTGDSRKTADAGFSVLRLVQAKDVSFGVPKPGCFTSTEDTNLIHGLKTR